MISSPVYQSSSCASSFHFTWGTLSPHFLVDTREVHRSYGSITWVSTSITLMSSSTLISILHQGQRLLRAVADSSEDVRLQLGRRLLQQDLQLVVVGDFEDLRCSVLAAAVRLALQGVDGDPHVGSSLSEIWLSCSRSRRRSGARHQ